MDKVFSVIIIPIVVGVIVLLVEYYVIQPWQNSRDLAAATTDEVVDSKWSAALKKGMKRFRDFQSSSSTFSVIERIRIEEIKIISTSATLIVSVKPRAYSLFILTRLYSLMRVDGISFPYETRYRLTIRDDGDIAEIAKLEEKFVKQHFKNQPSSPQIKDDLKLKEVNPPVSEVKSGNLRVTISFTVENIGRARKIHPVVEYKVARLKGGKFEEEAVTSPKDWIIELDPNCIQPISFSTDFNDVNVVVLTKPPHRISVKLKTVR